MTLHDAIKILDDRAAAIKTVSMRRNSIIEMRNMLIRWTHVEGQEERKKEAIKAALAI